MREQKYQLESLERTQAMGIALGEVLEPGAICLFFGEMAAGKTTLIKSVCAGLGVKPEVVTSPTYTLANEYPGRVTICHVDLFRIDTTEALFDLDRQDWLQEESVNLIEWPDLALPVLEGERCLELWLSAPPLPEGEHRRDLKMVDPTGNYPAVFQALHLFAE